MERLRTYLFNQRGPAAVLLVMLILPGIFAVLWFRTDLLASYKIWRQADREITLDDIARDGIKKFYFNRVLLTGTTDYQERFMEGEETETTFISEYFYYYVVGDQGYVVMIYTHEHPVIEGYEHAYWEGIVRRSDPKIRKWAREDQKEIEAIGLTFEPGYYVDLDSPLPRSDFFFNGLKWIAVWGTAILILLIPFLVPDKRTHYYE